MWDHDHLIGIYREVLHKKYHLKYWIGKVIHATFRNLKNYDAQHFVQGKGKK